MLQLCSNLKSLHAGKQIHQQITVSGWGKDPFMLTKLIQMYADCDHLFSAQRLFDKMPQPNVYAWTAIFGFYLRHGMYDKCVQNYGFMKYSDVLPDNYVFPKVLRACTQLLWFEGGIWIHKDVIVCGCESNLQVCNSLIDMYVKCGNARSARLVFEEMEERDLFSWNSMISGYVSNGLADLAVELLNCMRLDGFEPDVVTWNTLMDAYCQMGRFDEAWEVLKQIEQPNIISWTTLISSYSKIGEHDMSLRVFQDMIIREVVSPDLDCLCSVLVSCRHIGALRSGKEIHGYGTKMETNTVFYSSAGAALLTMYAKCGRIQDAINVFELMDKSDIVTWNAMILGFVELDLGKQAIECFREMQRMDIKNDQTTISTILPVCDLQYGNPIHAYVRKSITLSSVVTVWNAVIHMYCKCGCVRSAYTIFCSMPNKDVVSWNTMIGGFGMHGHGQAALKLLKEMILSGIFPNSTTFTSVLSACSHSGLVDEGFRLFRSMTEDYSITPRMEHYSCIVDMLARAGQFADAVTFIHKMPLEPDKSIWGALLAACRAYQNLDFGRLAAEQLIRMEPKCAGHYVTLSNIYARAGRWDDAGRVRKEIEGKGLVKPSGQSLIETRD
ncbi:pentatricopeptide repeat-containing protein, putative [Ricinus communis]|uniref:Pentatricopeptide repeat-containing protein, putative n=2 Tax=Ricinus communis TaxID=3988 RepID=B9SC35_RICCO|nr:pentatricopeptide repeat-containing protein, putative [Ricinus communis]